MTTIHPETSARTDGGASASPLPAAQQRAERTRQLFHRARSTSSVEERRDLMAAVIEMHLDLAHGQARRYRLRGIPLEDLEQVAALALTKATRGYDVTAGHDFLAYALPTIRGELRKHFRDHGWMVRPPRRVQELQATIRAAATDLTFTHGRSPKPSEIAHHLGESMEAVIEALGCDGCFVPASLDRHLGADGSVEFGELLVDSAADTDQRAAEARMMLGPVVGQLAERDQQILSMCFVEGLTQTEIGDRLGISQMQVSRLRTRILGELRKRLGELSPPDSRPQGHTPTVVVRVRESA
jgi:RNA polymerase sigma-B factor